MPEWITTPETVETRIGTLTFAGGTQSGTTAALVHDNLDFMRGVQAFLRGMSATLVRAVRNGLDRVCVTPNRAVGITEDLMDARSLFLTANTTTV